jgi:hypothetical protein
MAKTLIVMAGGGLKFVSSGELGSHFFIPTWVRGRPRPIHSTGLITMVITNHRIADGPQEENRHKIATSSGIDGATSGGDLLSVELRGPFRVEP